MIGTSKGKLNLFPALRSTQLSWITDAIFLWWKVPQHTLDKKNSVCLHSFSSFWRLAMPIQHNSPPTLPCNVRDSQLLFSRQLQYSRDASLREGAIWPPHRWPSSINKVGITVQQEYNKYGAAELRWDECVNGGAGWEQLSFWKKSCEEVDYQWKMHTGSLIPSSPSSSEQNMFTTPPLHFWEGHDTQSSLFRLHKEY